LKRKHELQRRNAEAKLKMLKIKQQADAEKTMTSLNTLNQ
jgi:hypothetical protein